LASHEDYWYCDYHAPRRGEQRTAWGLSFASRDQTVFSDVQKLFEKLEKSATIATIQDV